MSDNKGFCIDALAIDKDAAKAGKWFPFMGGSQVLIAKSGSTSYQKALADNYTKNKLEIDAGTDEGETTSVRLLHEAMAEHLVLDIKGFVDAEGNEVPYSKETIVAYLDHEEFYKFVQEKANDLSNWRLDAVKETGDKLKK